MSISNEQLNLKVNSLIEVLANGDKKINIDNFHNELWARMFIQYKRGRLSQITPIWKLIKEKIAEALSTQELNSVDYILDIASCLKESLKDLNNAPMQQAIKIIGLERTKAFISEMTLVMLYEYMSTKYPDKFIKVV